MKRWHIDRTRPAGTCLTLLVILLALAVTGCREDATDTCTTLGTATRTTAATTAVSENQTTPSSPVPVSAQGDEPDWLGTTSTGTGLANLFGSISYAASSPHSLVHVSLLDEAGELVDWRDAVLSFAFEGLEPGKYRLGVFAGQTGYISQWYGGLPVQGHDVSESQVLELRPGQNLVDFVLQPGFSIRGRATWSGGHRLGGDIYAYDFERRDTLRNGVLEGQTTLEGQAPMSGGVGYDFLIVGLLPGRYKLGVTFDRGFVEPEYWDGGGSFEDAPEIDLTSGDVTGVVVDLGTLPTTTTTGRP